jgi:DNA helicase-2/ATP-dependent DNA helicase PcrA
MRQRLTQIIGRDAYKVAIHTFHSFGSEIINQQGQFFYHGANFRPADELSSYEIIRGIFDELDYQNPLASKMNGEYTYLRDTLSSISELKRSGLTSDELLAVLDVNDGVLDAAEPELAEIFAARIGKTTADQLVPIIETLRTQDDTPPIPTITPLSRIMADSLETAVDQAQTSGKTTSVTAWKNAWLKKNDKGQFIFKTRERQTKLRSLSFIYYQYLARMQEAELYDFDDMILRVVHAMEVFPELRYNLQEKHQYIMVDEFQDTNMAQMRILHNLTAIPSGDQPNIMVVGDDDQAIYSFQGAEVGNIINFRDTYAGCELVVLTDNYRSAPIILEKGREVITVGSDRLENHIPELNKQLVAHKPVDGSHVTLHQLKSVGDEYSWLVGQITDQIKAGEKPSSIAVLARRHHEIIALLPYFASAGIRVNYERRDNVLDLEVIRHIEQVGTILVALFESRHDDANALLPELLAHPAWDIDPVDIWKLSLNAKNNHMTWMEAMATTPLFTPLHRWLVESSQLLAHLPLEQMLDHIIGHEAHSSRQSRTAMATSSRGLVPHLGEPSAMGEPVAPHKATRDEESSLGGDHVSAQASEHKRQDGSTFISPIFNYYFAPAKLQSTPDEYLTYLEVLRTIRGKLREYRPDELPKLQTMLEFIRLHRQLGSTITSIRPQVDQLDDAVNLMTAHKSKGLEFDSVYIVGAIDSAWGERVRSRSGLIGYPENLPLAPSGNTYDDRLRLFFVAMTRAKRQLSISYSLADLAGKESLRASFLTGDSWTAIPTDSVHTIDTLTEAAELHWYQPLVTLQQATMQELLQPLLAQYKLSATHLCAFLDVTHGGPQGFLLQNLLRFPQAISPHAGYGSAIHKTLQRAHSHLSATGKHRAPEDILRDYENNLRDQHLADADFQTFLQKGSDVLQLFLDEKYITFTPNQIAELNFAGQHAILGDAHLTGSLDLIDTDDNTMIVTDYKTGRPVGDWKGVTDYDRIKLHKYRQQLMFYKLLVEHSRDYANYTVERGVLQFVEPTKSGEIIALDATFDHEELDRFARLIQKVWHCITELHLPDTSQYDPSYKGILAFEAALLDEE